MIIELFGPPGVGKTTFAQALSARLSGRGLTVEVTMSSRPLENPSVHRCRKPQASPHSTVVVQRLAKPLIDLLATGSYGFTNTQEVSQAIKLVKLIPAKNIFWTIRLFRYLLQLSRSWRHASLSNHIVLFDQAFVQAVCSLALLARVSDDKSIALALDSVPKPDLLIRLDAPQQIIESRLRDRHRLQSRFERLFELDIRTSLKSIQIIDQLNDLLRERNRPVTRLDCVDQPSLCEAVERAEQEVMANFGAEQDSTAGPTGTANSQLQPRNRAVRRSWDGYHHE
jgi:thymidylate kinase